jgi:AcrR family transcriptional regulator
MDERRTDTREAIRSVALELFAEQGYEKTSLREISERLGVTKAAVYYHFKTKEEILLSLIEDFLTQIDDLADWAQSRPAGVRTRQEVLRRYSDLLDGRTMQLARFLHEGHAQAAGPAYRHPRHVGELLWAVTVRPPTGPPRRDSAAHRDLHRA